jgi:hypothetical protein
MLIALFYCLTFTSREIIRNYKFLQIANGSNLITNSGSVTYNIAQSADSTNIYVVQTGGPVKYILEFDSTFNSIQLSQKSWAANFIQIMQRYD